MKPIFILAVIFIFFSFSSGNDAKELKVAMSTTLPPMHFKDDKGNLVGFEVDLVKLFAEKNGFEIKFINPTDQNKSSFELVKSGEVDFAVNSLTITEERKKFAIFSEPYFTSGTGIISNSKSIDLNFSNCTALYLENLISKTVLSQLKTNQTRALSNIDQIINLIKTEKYHHLSPFIFIHDWISLQEIVKRNTELCLYGYILEAEPYGAVFKNQEDCMQWNAFLNQIRLDNQYNMLFKKWFADLKVPEMKSVSNIMKDAKSNQQTVSYTNAEILSSSDDISKFLPVLFKESFIVGFIADKNKIYEHLKSKFNKKYLPQIEEIFLKGGIENSYQFYDFILDTDSAEILPLIYRFLYFREPFASKNIDILLTAMSIRHPELRNEIVSAYDNYLESQKKIKFDLFDSCSETKWDLEMVLYLDEKKQMQRKVTISDNTSFSLLKVGNDNLTKVKVDNVLGILKEMPLRGESRLRINKVNEGLIDEFSFPQNFQYHEVSENGNIFSFFYKDLIFYYDLQNKAVFKIRWINPVNDQKNIKLALSKLSGIKYSGIYFASDGQIYYFARDQSNFHQCDLYSKSDSTGKTTKKISFLTNQGGCPSDSYILDNKLFFTGIGYDYYERYGIVDLQTGCKIDTGYGGAIVPIGSHQLYYCSGNYYEPHQSLFYIIDTKTLKRIETKPLDCPGGVGKIEPHPFPGYFLYISWSIC